jgi:LmbE family N-acetylglucosaminyl deacetylase
MTLLTPAVAATAAPGNGLPADTVDLDVLFVSAHPDDEASSLAALGQWKENFGAKAGVITITRGEGGGNAVGLEEGPPLGIIREREERTAIGKAGIEHLYNLDRVDFWYTHSAPLSADIWQNEDALEQVVRVIRQTKPEIIITMNPSPTQGNHGNHQQAARFAAEAFYAAADPKRFPDQLNKEKLSVHRAAKFLRTGGTGTSSTGPNCASSFNPTLPIDQVFGVWEGTQSLQQGKTWAEIEVEARREYVTQGWANSADAATDPARIRCDFFTLVDSRVPYDPSDSSPEAILRGSVLPPVAGGLPQGTEFFLTTDRYEVGPGESFEVTAHVRAPQGQSLTKPRVTLTLPEGWTVTGNGSLGASVEEKEKRTKFTVTVPANAGTDVFHLLRGTLTTLGQGAGTTDEPVSVLPAVRGVMEPLPEVAVFRQWVREAGYPQLDNLIAPVLTLGSGQSRDVRIDLTNSTSVTQSGTVTLGLPAGFAADELTKSYADLPAGGTGSVTFRVTNTDANLPNANTGGTYPVTITTTSNGATSVQTGGLQLVPVTVIPRAGEGHHVDGVESEGEYPGEVLDVSRVWEGTVTTPQDASATAKVAYTDDALKVIVHVTDDILGRKVLPQDCKRQRRTDSVEIIIDPKGNSVNTSTVFKAGIFPATDDPANGDPPCWQRDADNRQGPGAVTAPGMTVASKVTSPYTGYTIEASIPFDVLPDAVDPDRMGFNILVYDSDTQDLSSQTRIGWSTFSAVRADPYRYGLTTLPGYVPTPREPSTPVFPDTAARSVHSPQTVAQAAVDGVAPAAVRRLPDSAFQISNPAPVNGGYTVTITADRKGTAYLYSWDGDYALGSRTVELRANQTLSVFVPSEGAATTILGAFESAANGAAVAHQVALD